MAANKLTFAKFSKLNRKRCHQFFNPINQWSPTDWACCVAGEIGEACNFIKKLKRLESNCQHKPRKNRQELLDAIGKEIADIYCYLDLLAARFDFDMEKLIKSKFNEVSNRVKSQIKL